MNAPLTPDPFSISIDGSTYDHERFADKHPSESTSFRRLFSQFSEGVLPRRLLLFFSMAYLKSESDTLRRTMETVEDAHLPIRITENDDGIPVFPALDILAVPLKQMIRVLKEYLLSLWGEYLISKSVVRL